MGHLLSTYYWKQSAFSGTTQLDLGPFDIGVVNKLFKAEANGQVNVQAQAIGSSGVTSNELTWAVYWVPHGNPSLNIITTFDSDTFLIRRQTGSEDNYTTWAPSTATGVMNQTLATVDRWAGQLFLNQHADLWISMVTSTGAGWSNSNTFGTVRLWWN